MTIMTRSIRRLTRAGIIASAGGLVFATAASACHPEITARQTCDGLVTYTTTAWATSEPDKRVHPDIKVSVNGKRIANGMFTKANGYSFSGVVQLPEPGPATVKAESIGKWGRQHDVEPAYDSRSVTVRPPDGCEKEETPPTTAAPTTTTVAPTTTTKPPETTRPPETTVNPGPVAQGPPETTNAPEPKPAKPAVKKAAKHHAKHHPAPVAAKATVRQGPDELPFTGAGLAPITAGLSVLLFGGGGAALLGSRRTRKS